MSKNTNFQKGDLVDFEGSTVEFDHKKGGWSTVITDSGQVKKVRNSAIKPLEDRVEAAEESHEEPEEALESQDPAEGTDLDEESQEEAQDEAQDEAEEDEPEARGSIVKEEYRRVYAERGNPHHCGDWLAQVLDGAFLSKAEGRSRPYFDVGAFERMLVANGVSLTGKWATLPESGTRGWQGRYRMNGRQKLERALAESGATQLDMGDGSKITIPQDVIDNLADKHQ